LLYIAIKTDLTLLQSNLSHSCHISLNKHSHSQNNEEKNNKAKIFYCEKFLLFKRYVFPRVIGAVSTNVNTPAAYVHVVFLPIRYVPVPSCFIMRQKSFFVPGSMIVVV